MPPYEDGWNLPPQRPHSKFSCCFSSDDACTSSRFRMGKDHFREGHYKGGLQSETISSLRRCWAKLKASARWTIIVPLWLIVFIRTGTIREIICSLKKKKKPDDGSEQGPRISNKERGSRTASSTPAAGENALRYLFLTWLQEALIHEYHPGQQRNLRGRLLRIMAKTKVDSIKLSAVNVYIANSSFKYNFTKHRIIVAWGNKKSTPASLSTTHPYIMNIPIYSLDDHQQKVQDISVHKSVYDPATLTRRNVDAGYWVLYRSENENGKLSDTELIFEPADLTTGIPVESSYEEEMVRFLVNSGRHFKNHLSEM